MRGQALIIGSQTYGLTGAHRDAERMAEALGTLGFEVDCRMGAEATREGILQGYRRLIEACAPGEAAFVYYAGHGAWSLPEPGHGLQFIVPVDFGCSSEEDFRGITSQELSGLLAELTARTRNVTVVLDCCFAACMFRAPGLLSRGLPEIPRAIVDAHLARERTRGCVLGGAHVESNPHAVRLVASSLDEPAYEYTNAQGERTGLLTDTFLHVLQEARGLRVSWGQLGRRVRERILARCPAQRPELEGPCRRLLFQLEELERDGALAYYPALNRHWLRGGRLHGVRLGDEYAVMPLGAMGPDTGQALALARVIEVQGGSSRVELERRADSPPPAGAPSFLVRSVQPRRPVVLEGPWETAGALHRRVREGLEASSLVRQASADEQEPVLARVRLEDEAVDVFDQGGDRIVHSLPPVPDRSPTVLRALEVLARAQELRELASAEGAEQLDSWLEFEWGRVEGGRALRLPSAGACLRASERVYVRVRNRGHSHLYVSLFDIGVGGAITLLSTSQPSGLMLGPGREQCLGARFDGALVGLELEWPVSVPREGERPESLVIIAMDRREDLRLLETSGVRSPRALAVSLERLLQGVGGGGTRAVSPPGRGTSPLGYTVKHIRFWLDPRPPP